jgi:phosphatidylglycerophosphatase A
MDKLIIENGQLITVRVDARFMWRHPLHVVAQGFGSGLSPIAPGTVGTLFGWLCFDMLQRHFASVMNEPALVFSALLLAFVLGVWACQVTGKHLGVSDHGSLVWDEIVAVFLALLFTPHTFARQLFAVVLFRFFDIRKPTPIKILEARVPGGLGVMLDDLVAAFYTLVAVAVVKAVFFS